MRKTIKAILQRYGLTNRFSVRHVDSTDLARDSVMCVTIRDWRPNKDFPAIEREIKAALAEQGVKAIVVAEGPGVIG